MDLNEIYVFSKVAEMGSFTKASEFLGMPKSRVSRKVSSLERELGVQLIYRTTRQIELTPAGRSYYTKCHPLLMNLDILNSEISTFSDDISGPIRITAPEDVGLRLFPKLASEFMSLYPKVTLDFYFTGRMVDLIKEPIDLALRVGKLQDSELKSRKVGELSSILVATPTFLSHHPELKTVHDLEKVNAVGFGQFGKIAEWNLKSSKADIKIRPKTKLTTNTMDFLLQLVLEHQGVALIPNFIVREKLKTGELVQLFHGLKSPSIPIHFLTAPQKEPPMKIKRFIDFSIEKFALIFNERKA